MRGRTSARTFRRPLAASLGLLLLATAAGADTLLVGAAASLREPVESIARRFEAGPGGHRVELSFGSSSALAAQIRLGAPIDVLLSADPEILDALRAEGFVASGGRLDFAANRLAVVVRADSPLGIATPADLSAPAIERFALPSAAVPLGRYAREWLARHGLDRALHSRSVVTEHARATLAAVAAGNADAAIVYVTDAATTDRVRVGFRIPPDEQPRIAYAAAQIARTRAPATSLAFLGSLRGAPAQNDLRRAGFAAADEGAP